MSNCTTLSSFSLRDSSISSSCERIEHEWGSNKGERENTNLLGLHFRAREAVEHEATLAVGAVEVVVDNVHNKLIRHQTTGLHDGSSLLAKGSVVGNGITEHVTGGQVAHAVLVNNAGGLSALSAARRADQDGADALLLRALGTAGQLLDEVISGNVAKVRHVAEVKG